MDLTRAVVDAKDSCQELTDSCKEMSDSCQELADSYKSLQAMAMAADLLSSLERFKVQQAAATSSRTTTTTPPSTSTTPPPTPPQQTTPTPEEAPASYSIPTMSAVAPHTATAVILQLPTRCSTLGVAHDAGGIDDKVALVEPATVEAWPTITLQFWVQHVLVPARPLVHPRQGPPKNPVPAGDCDSRCFDDNGRLFLTSSFRPSIDAIERGDFSPWKDARYIGRCLPDNVSSLSPGRYNTMRLIELQHCTMHERQAPKAIYECDFLEWQVEAWTHAFLYMKYDAELVNQIGKSLKNCFCYPTSSEWIIHMRLGLTSLDLMSDGLAYPWLMVVASIFPSVISMAYPCAQMYAARPAREANDVKGLEFSIHNSEFYSLLSTRPGYHHGSPESYFADFPWIIAWSFIRGSSFGTNKRERPIHEANGINFENEGVLLFVHEYWQGMFGCLQWDPGGICKASSELGWEQAKSQTSWELPKELGYIELSWELPEELGYIELSWELPEELGYIELWQLETFLQNIQYDAKVVNQIAEEMLLCTWIKFNGNNLTGNICFGFSHFQHYGHLARFACLVHAYQLINIDRKTWDYLALVLQGRP